MPKQPVDPYTKSKKELVIFLIFFGALFSGLGVWAATSKMTGPPFLGFKINLAMGVPTIVIGVLCLISGIGLAATSKSRFAVAGAISGTLVPIFYFGFFVMRTGTVPINLMTGVAVLIPIMLWIAVGKFNRASERNEA